MISLIQKKPLLYFTKLIFDKKVFQNYSIKSYKYLLAMNKAYFRLKPEDNQLQISFRYINSDFNIDREFNFCRNLDENITVCLDRIKNNIAKELNKKSKKKNKKKGDQNDESKPNNFEVPEIIPVKLLRQNNVIEANSTFSSLLETTKGKDISLKIFNDNFEVEYNKPWIATLTLPSVILAGYFLYPSKLEMYFAKKECSKGVWFKGLMPKSNDINKAEWIEIDTGLIYKTKNDDIGYFIKFQLIPANETDTGPSIDVISKSEIQAGPGICPFESRHQFTQKKLSNDKFRVVSYNLLADYYADSDHSRKELFPYCPPYALAIEYRKQLFIKEIIGYNADIICLQELDAKVFDLDLIPLLEPLNFNGILEKKGSTAEGVCVFYRNDRFDLIRNIAINIGENIPKLEIFSELHNKIKENKPLMERVCDRATTLQVVILKSKDTGNYIIQANTHLYFHPDADHIRLLQGGFSMLYVQGIYDEILKEFNLKPEQISILFCGDFNSVPECGIYKLLTEQYVDENFIDWSSNKEEEVKNVSLTQPYQFGSACGTPEYTNYTHLFSGCLDYIFYQKNNLEVDQVIPFPSNEEIKAHIAIPSVVFPSDHIALIADLKWKSKQS